MWKLIPFFSLVRLIQIIPHNHFLNILWRFQSRRLASRGSNVDFIEHNNGFINEDLPEKNSKSMFLHKRSIFYINMSYMRLYIKQWQVRHDSIFPLNSIQCTNVSTLAQNWFVFLSNITLTFNCKT